MRASRERAAALVMAIGIFLAIPAAASAAPREAVPDSPPVVHVVRPGDTLWAIAGRYRVSVDALAAANGLANPDALSLGQRLVIPQSASRSAPARPRAATVTHVVAAGDTLWAIATRYGTTVEAVVRENGLPNADALALGQRLRIPGGQARQVAASPSKAPSSAAPARRAIAPDAIPSRGAKWGSTLLTVATRVVGVRYRWGGTTPRGFDCSGFITYVMRAVSVAVPRTTYAMWAAGTPVARDELKVGDIVFFNTTRPGPSHAGIYIGGNQFIHSSSGFGRVTITSMDYRYYKPRYMGARRF